LNDTPLKNLNPRKTGVGRCQIEGRKTPVAGDFNNWNDTVHIAVSAINVPSGQPYFAEIPTALKKSSRAAGRIDQESAVNT
jgi:hypothetical protein